MLKLMFNAVQPFDHEPWSIPKFSFLFWDKFMRSGCENQRFDHLWKQKNWRVIKLSWGVWQKVNTTETVTRNSTFILRVDRITCRNLIQSCTFVWMASPLFKEAFLCYFYVFTTLERNVKTDWSPTAFVVSCNVQDTHTTLAKLKRLPKQSKAKLLLHFREVSRQFLLQRWQLKHNGLETEADWNNYCSWLLS